MGVISTIGFEPSANLQGSHLAGKPRLKDAEAQRFLTTDEHRWTRIQFAAENAETRGIIDPERLSERNQMEAGNTVLPEYHSSDHGATKCVMKPTKRTDISSRVRRDARATVLTFSDTLRGDGARG
jgi:hypothetical protein